MEEEEEWEQEEEERALQEVGMLVTKERRGTSLAR